MSEITKSDFALLGELARWPITVSVDLLMLASRLEGQRPPYVFTHAERLVMANCLKFAEANRAMADTFVQNMLIKQ